LPSCFAIEFQALVSQIFDVVEMTSNLVYVRPAFGSRSYLLNFRFQLRFAKEGINTSQLSGHF